MRAEKYSRTFSWICSLQCEEAETSKLSVAKTTAFVLVVCVRARPREGKSQEGEPWDRGMERDCRELECNRRPGIYNTNWWSSPYRFHYSTLQILLLGVLMTLYLHIILGWTPTASGFRQRLRTGCELIVGRKCHGGEEIVWWTKV